MLIRPVEKGDEEVLRRIATEILEPLYGDQTKAFNEWMIGAGFKHAFVPIKDSEVAGLLSLKANPEKSYLKVSTLVVLLDCKKNGCGRAMMSHVWQFAKEHGFRSIIVTVSEAKSESVRFFRKNGFHIVDERLGKYQEGVIEFIMEKEVA